MYGRNMVASPGNQRGNEENNAHPPASEEIRLLDLFFLLL
jgi:hypothetical protein